MLGQTSGLGGAEAGKSQSTGCGRGEAQAAVGRAASHPVPERARDLAVVLDPAFPFLGRTSLSSPPRFPLQGTKTPAGFPPQTMKF